ncbi:MAG: hypothetical protein KDI30_08725 [Pseudomonadales bacterium]|nr:hypothetical protein [Pseudomonadales bacterium]
MSQFSIFKKLFAVLSTVLILSSAHSEDAVSIEVDEALYKALRFGASRTGPDNDSKIDFTSYSVVSRAIAEDQRINEVEWELIKLMDKEQVNFEFYKIDSSGKREKSIFSGRPDNTARKYMVDNLLLGVSISLFEKLWNDDSPESIDTLVALSKKDQRSHVAIVNHIARKYIAYWIEVKDSKNQYQYAKLMMSKYFFNTNVHDKTVKAELKSLSREAANMAELYIQQEKITPEIPSWIMKPFNEQ